MERVRFISFIICSFLLCSFQTKGQEFFGDWYQDEVVIVQNLSDSMFVNSNTPEELKQMVVQSMVNQDNGKTRITLTKDSLHTYRPSSGSASTAIKWIDSDKYHLSKGDTTKYSTLELMPDGRLKRISMSSENVYYFRRNATPAPSIKVE